MSAFSSTPRPVCVLGPPTARSTNDALIREAEFAEQVWRWREMRGTMYGAAWPVDECAE